MLIITDKNKWQVSVIVITISCVFRCVLAAPFLGCLKGEILFLINIFEPNSESQTITVNSIFGAGTQGPYRLELVPGDKSALAISTDGNLRKRILITEQVPTPIKKDIAGEAALYIITVEKEKVLLEMINKNGVRYQNLSY